ncbi:unnamed protein product [Durusdinium trenchii]|uniref:Major facilitator superfamily (MFS) profile domain-containing protein n=1 Tax=Durusdinium trenchii TaxID=1381693 RepID=A0ABP0IGT2_9DINO
MAKKVIASFVNHVFTFGPIYSFGVFLPIMKADLGISLTEASAISSTMNTAQFVGSLLAGLVIPQRLGHASVAFFGAVAVLIGLALLSMVESVYHAYPAVILAGLGLGSSNLAGLVALNATVPPRKRAMLVGFATCGTSVGTILLPQFYTLLSESLGWRWAMRINAITSFLFLLMAAPFFFVAKAATPARTQDVAVPQKCCSPLRDLRFVCWWIDMFVCFFGYFAPPTLLADFVQTELQLSAREAAMAYTLIGVSALATRLCLGFVTHLCGGPRRVHFASQVLVGAIACCLPLCWNAESLLAWSVLYGFSIGPVIALVSVVLSELFGTQELARYHGISRVGVGAGNLLGVPVTGWLAETQGYALALVSGGCLVSFSSIFLIALEVLHRKRKQKAQAGAQVNEASC